MRWRCATAAAAALAAAAPARAHHGVAAVSVAGPEGPGAALETTSALPLPEGTLFGMVKSEYVPFQRYASADPANKDYALFSMAAVGYGLRPWLSLYLFQPVNVKEQDGIGRNVGAGDPNLMLTLAFKWDGGLQLVPERESLDDLLDWHFSAWAASTAPLGPTEHTDRAGAPFAPDMQTGFGSPSTTLGAAALKQLGPDVTWLADATWQYFFPHAYGFTRYQFGAETRVDTALVWRVLGRGALRVDVAGELNGLWLGRDRARDAGGAMAGVPATGGAVLYGGLGVRASLGRFSAALGVRRAALKRLDEQALQQGAEGLEKLRATLALSASASI